MIKVPFVDLTGQYQQIKQEVLKKIEPLMEQGAFILGEDVKQFESDFASYIGVKYGNCKQNHRAQYN